MPRIGHEEKSRRRLIEYLQKGEIKKLPFTPSLKNYHKFCELSEGVWLVEEIKNTPVGRMKLFVQKPDGKTPRDFNVWIVFKDVSNNLVAKMPKHGEFFEFFEKACENGVGNELFTLIKRLIFDKANIEGLLQEASQKLQQLSYKHYNLEVLLKSVILIYSQEECNYPQTKGMLGMKFPFIGFILIKSGLYSAKDVNRIFIMAFRKK